MIIALTGCIYAFQAEIQDAVQEYRYVQKQERNFLPPSILKKIAEQIFPDKHLHAVLYSGPDRAAQVIFFSFDPEYYDVVYLNPYSGDLLKIKDMETDFFHIILDGHFYLWLPPEVGQPLAATFTLIFVVMLISGLILWWPRKKKDSRQRFTIKWNGKWRRRNYDLHNVVGFYAMLIALLLSLTGLVWGFQWFANGVHAVAGGSKSLVYADPLSDTTIKYEGKRPAIDEVYFRMTAAHPEAKSIEVHIPSTPEVAIAANSNPDLETYWKIDYRYFDQNTLKEIPVDHIYGRFSEAQAADKIIRLNYDIHTGAVFGLWGKAIAFIASLICASLPVTGFVIWLGRKNKTKRKSTVKVERKIVTAEKVDIRQIS
jgi:uncharacterized iron-regulated membrane protein